MVEADAAAEAAAAEAGDATEAVATKTGSSADWPQKKINNIYSI